MNRLSMRQLAVRLADCLPGPVLRYEGAELAQRELNRTPGVGQFKADMVISAVLGLVLYSLAWLVAELAWLTVLGAVYGAQHAVKALHGNTSNAIKETAGGQPE